MNSCSKAFIATYFLHYFFVQYQSFFITMTTTELTKDKNAQVEQMKRTFLI